MRSLESYSMDFGGGALRCEEPVRAPWRQGGSCGSLIGTVESRGQPEGGAMGQRKLLKTLGCESVRVSARTEAEVWEGKDCEVSTIKTSELKDPGR